MKLIIAIMHEEDRQDLQEKLTKAGHSATVVASTGAFLRSGNITFLIGAKPEVVDEVLAIIKQCGRRRTQVMTAVPMDGAELAMIYPVEVVVGGATVFVVDVDRHEKY